MRRKSTILILCVLMIAVGVLCSSLVSEFRDFRARTGSVYMSCWSDRLYILCGDIHRLVEQNNGTLPDLSLVRAFYERSPITLTCAGADAPFKWNHYMASLRLNSKSTHILAWCPLGSHNGYYGVIVLSSGEIRSKVIAVNELAKLMEGELTE